MTEETQQSSIVGAHPAAGLLALAVVPGSKECETPDVTIGPLVFAGTGHPGILAGIILEVGDMTGHTSEEFNVGDKVFFPADRGIQIGDRYFLGHASILAFQRMDEI